MNPNEKKLTLQDKDWFGMSVKYLQVSHLGHKDHLKQLHHQLSLYKLFVSSEYLKFFSKSIPENVYGGQMFMGLKMYV